jgi:hypothetical protein
MKEKVTQEIYRLSDPDESKKLTKEESTVLFQDIKNENNKATWKKFIEVVKKIKFPAMTGIKGATHRIQTHIYPTQNDIAQQLFERSKVYRTRSQLDRRIYSIGLEWLKVEHFELGLKLEDIFDPIMAQIYEEDRIDEWKATVIAKYKDYLNKIAIGVLTDDEVVEKVEKWVNCFPTDKLKAEVRRMINHVDQGGELVKAKDRVRHKYTDRLKLKEWELHKNE